MLCFVYLPLSYDHWSTNSWFSNYVGVSFLACFYSALVLTNFRATKPVFVTVKLHVSRGDVTKVELLNGCGVPDVDQEFADFIRKKWTAAPGANQNYPASMTAHRGYYPG